MLHGTLCCVCNASAAGLYCDLIHPRVQPAVSLNDEQAGCFMEGIRARVASNMSGCSGSPAAHGASPGAELSVMGADDEQPCLNARMLRAPEELRAVEDVTMTDPSPDNCGDSGPPSSAPGPPRNGPHAASPNPLKRSPGQAPSPSSAPGPSPLRMKRTLADMDRPSTSPGQHNSATENVPQQPRAFKAQQDTMLAKLQEAAKQAGGELPEGWTVEVRPAIGLDWPS
jgi:hypothetical protein